MNTSAHSQPENSIWAKRAFLGDRWVTGALIRFSSDGNIIDCQPNTAATDGEIIHGTLLPGMTNLHSHAHQRAMAGLAEKANHSRDSFWTWRKSMYHFLAKIQPDDLYAIASQLYLEALKFGYTCIAEFQYLHHDINGNAYSDPAEMSKQCLQAANDIGIAFTGLPVLYHYSGFNSLPANTGQLRFINDAEQFLRIVNSLNKEIDGNSNHSIGIAPHSLRAIDEELLQQVLEGCDITDLIHLHIAEQIKEVDDCINWSGQRPVEWLLNHFNVDSNWCLIHATHMDSNETEALAMTGAAAGLCPTTEANLGDGLFNAKEFFSNSGHWGIGSDSHISISPFEELRWLEYGQRLKFNSRNLLSGSQYPNTGRYLYQNALQGGAQASKRKSGLIRPGYRADFIVIDDQHPRLYQRSEDELLDSLIFSGNENMITDVYVGGHKVIEQGKHPLEQRILKRYQSTLKRLQA